MDVKRVVQQKIQGGLRNFVFDLDRCPMMDSTFLGTLTGVARDLRQNGGGRVTVVNVNARNEQLLSSLGLNHVLEVDMEGSAWAEERKVAASELAICEKTPEICKTEQAAHVLDAHKALSRANEANASRFRDVIDYLEKDLGDKGKRASESEPESPEYEKQADEDESGDEEKNAGEDAADSGR